MSNNNNSSFLGRYGEVLLKKGYPIVPIKPGLKHPGFKNWQKLDVTETHIKKWLSTGFANGGVGIRSKHFPAVDIDVYDPEINELIVSWCENNIGSTVKRVGEHPKILLVFRTDKPFSKITSKKYRDFLGVEHKLEILCDGQQFVAFAMHPDTGKPYQWVSEKTLAELKPEELPLLTAEKAQALIEYFESVIPDDWETAEQGSTGVKTDYKLSETEKVLLYSKPKIDLPMNKLVNAVNMLDPNMGRTPWIKVGMGLFHQFGGDSTGFEIWNDWSCKGSSYNPHEMQKCWHSFASDLSKEPVTAATIIHMAKDVYKKKKADESTRKGFQLIHAQDIVSKLGPIDWQVKNYFEANTTGIMFGDPGSYKSFIALDIAIHCAIGRDWHGNSVRQGPVIYVAGEGHGGFARRLAAFQKVHNITLNKDVPLYFSQQAASLYNAESAEQVTEAIDNVTNDSGKPVMIVLDTLARNFGAGDENSTSDMNVFVEHVDRFLRMKYNCTVLIVHHTGHSNKERARGSMALKGALDFEFRIDKVENSVEYATKMTCTKMKDAVEPPETWFEGESVLVGTFDDDDMTSLVFRKSAAPIQEEVRLKGKQKACYELLRNAVEGDEGIEKKALQQMLVDAEISKNIAQARNLVNTLTEKGYLIEFKGFLRVDDFFK